MLLNRGLVQGAPRMAGAAVRGYAQEEAVSVAHEGMRKTVMAALGTPADRISEVVQVDSSGVQIGGRVHSPDQRFRVLSVGKAATETTRVLRGVLGSRVTRSLTVGKKGGEAPTYDRIYGEHPTPGIGSFQSANRVRSFVGGRGGSEGLIVAVSGGTTSILGSPDPELERVLGQRYPLETFSQDMKTIMLGEQPIHLQNLFRGLVTGTAEGRLLPHVGTPTTDVLIVSDVVQNGLSEQDEKSAVGSGPFEPTESRPEETIALMKGTGLWDQVSDCFKTFTNCRAEMDRPVSFSTDVHSQIVESNALALGRIAGSLREQGWHVHVDPRVMDGPIQEEAQRTVEMAMNIFPGVTHQPVAIVRGGEPIPDLTGLDTTKHKGGRMGSMAAWLSHMFFQRNVRFKGVSLATDGEDNGPWMGGYSSYSIGRNCVMSDFMRNVDAYNALPRVAQIDAEHTGTNVADISVVFDDRGLIL